MRTPRKRRLPCFSADLTPSSPALAMTLALVLAAVVTLSGCTGPSGRPHATGGTLAARLDFGRTAAAKGLVGDETEGLYLRLTVYSGSGRSCQGPYIDASQVLPAHPLYESADNGVDFSTRSMSFSGIPAGHDRVLVLDLVLKQTGAGAAEVPLGRGCVEGVTILAEPAPGASPTTVPEDGQPIVLAPPFAPTPVAFSPRVVAPGEVVRIVGSGFSNVPALNAVTFPTSAPEPERAEVQGASPVALDVIVPAGAISGAVGIRVMDDADAPLAPEPSLTPNRLIVVHRTTATIPVGTAPSAVEIAGSRALVANLDSGTVSEIDLRSHAPTREPVTIGGRPTDLALAGATLLVTDEERDALLFLDHQTLDRARDPVAVGMDPSAVAANESLALVLNATDNTVSVVGAKGTSAGTIEPRENVGQIKAIDLGGEAAYLLSEGGVISLDLSTGELAPAPLFFTFLPTDIAVKGSLGYVTDGGLGTLTEVDISSGDTKALIPVGRFPTRVRLAGTRAYVIDKVDRSVSIVDLEARAQIEPPVTVGADPSDVASWGNFAYVTNQLDGTLSAILASAANPTGRSLAGARGEQEVGPADLAPWGSRLVVLASPRTRPGESPAAPGTLLVLDPSSNRFEGEVVTVGFKPTAVAVAGDRALVANGFARAPVGPDDSSPGSLSVVDLATRSVVGGEIALAGHPEKLVLGAGRAYVLATNPTAIEVVDLDGGTVEATVALDAPFPVGIAASGERLFVLDAYYETVTAIDTQTLSAAGSPIPVGNTPTSISADASWVVVANSIDGTITRIDPSTLAVAGATIQVGTLPFSLAVQDGLAYVLDSFNGRVVLVDLPSGAVHPSPTTLDLFGETIVLGDGFAYVSSTFLNAIGEVDIRTN